MLYKKAYILHKGIVKYFFAYLKEYFTYRVYFQSYEYLNIDIETSSFRL